MEEKSKKKLGKGLVYGGIATAILALASVGYIVLKPKKSTETDNSDYGSGSGGNANTGSGSGGAGSTFLTNILNTGTDILGGAGQGGTASQEGYLADVVYLVDRSNDGEVLDPNIMEIRLNTDHAKVSVGNTVKLVGAGASYDGTYPVIDLWGSSGDAKTIMVQKTAGLGATAKKVPGAKVYIVPSGSSFSGKNKDVVNEISKHAKIL